MAEASKASSAGKKSAGKKSTTKKSTTKKKAPAKKGTPNKRATKKKATKKRSPAKRGTTKKRATKKKATKKRAASKKGTSKKGTSKSSRGTRKKSSSPFSTKFLETMRKLLQVERETYARQARQLRAEAESLVADLDPGDVQFDEESGEGDTIAVERNRDLALAAKALEMIEEIDHALAKLDEGTYGICEISGEPIPEERLEAIPWARERVEYKVGGFGRR